MLLIQTSDPESVSYPMNFILSIFEAIEQWKKIEIFFACKFV